MKNCECGCNKFITVSTIFINELVSDAEPYKNGIEESLTLEDEEYLESQELEISINICSKCKKHHYWINGIEYIKNQQICNKGWEL